MFIGAFRPRAEQIVGNAVPFRPAADPRPMFTPIRLDGARGRNDIGPRQHWGTGAARSVSGGLAADHPSVSRGHTRGRSGQSAWRTCIRLALSGPSGRHRVGRGRTGQQTEQDPECDSTVGPQEIADQVAHQSDAEHEAHPPEEAALRALRGGGEGLPERVSVARDVARDVVRGSGVGVGHALRPLQWRALVRTRRSRGASRIPGIRARSGGAHVGTTGAPVHTGSVSAG